MHPLLQLPDGAERCGHVHEDLVCQRAPHPHDPDADMGEGKPRGNVTPHLGLDDDGQLVQWVSVS